MPIVNTNLPTLIIKPKIAQNTEKSRKEIQKSINPISLNIGIRNLKETRKGNIVLKCDTEGEIGRLEEEIGKKLGGKYETDRPKKVFPKIKIANYTGGESSDVLESIIRKQNPWINRDEHLKVTFIRKFRNKSTLTIYAECSGSLYVKMLTYGKIYINWERLPVYEDLTISRCYQCQGFNHKNNKCTRKQVCGNCAGNHVTTECESETKKCINCITANKQYNTEYEIDHSALDASCPSLEYHIKLLRSKTDYNT